jgi:hypothetical protein
MLRALKLSPSLLVEEPARTLVTLAAAGAQQALPGAVFDRIGTYAMARAGQASGVRL